MKIMCTHMSNLCLLTSLHYDKLTSGSEYQLSRPVKSSLLRSIPLSSSIFSFSDPRKWRHVASGPQTLLFAVQNLQPNNEDCGPILTEEYFTRQSVDEVRKEILDCYKLVDKLGRGAVYLGSVRIEVDHSIYLKAKELAQEVSCNEFVTSLSCNELVCNPKSVMYV